MIAAIQSIVQNAVAETIRNANASTRKRQREQQQRAQADDGLPRVELYEAAGVFRRKEQSARKGAGQVGQRTGDLRGQAC